MSTNRPDSSLFGTLAIVGVGLLGGSLGLACRERGIAKRIIGVGRDLSRLAKAVSAGIIDEAFVDLKPATSQADLIVVCTPVDQVADVVGEVAQFAPPHALITDVGSTKGTIDLAVRAKRLPPGRFIGSHPIAGSEKVGFEHAVSHLFDWKVCIICPDEKTPADRVEFLTNFWNSVGSRVIPLAPSDHDNVVALTSHLPHVAAAAMASLLPQELVPFVGTGFRDTTRVASGNPDLWVSILMNNRPAAAVALASLQQMLSKYQVALSHGNAEALAGLLSAGKTSRDRLS
jgi:prephenate dehydrogenase